MDNLRSVLNIVLSKIPTSLIVNSEIQYDNINRDTFVKIAGYYLKYYSNDELDNLFDYIKNEYEDQANYVRGFEIGKYEDKEGFSVFDAILIFATRVLQEIDGEPICRYENVLRWRFTSHLLEEDIFTTAYLAFQDCREGKRNRDFSWKPVIGNNNEHLNWILRQGLADNHFHLKGSAPQFPLSWINMMNHVRSKKYEKILEGYGNKRLSVSYEIGTEEEHLYSLYLKAALIRCFLFAQITEQEFFIANNLVRNNYDPDPETRKWSTENLVMFLLKDKTEIIFYRNKIQENIDFFRTNKGEKQLDYALTGEYRKGIGKNEVNNSLSGERWLMYEMFLRIYAKSVKDALALGEDPDEYYEGKKNCILITQQDYLDNLVWVYYRIKRFSLIGYEDLLLNIEQEYNKYFRLIYGDAVSDEFFEAVIREAGKYFQRSNERVSKGYSNTHFNFRISEYYSAWQLRGDDPECYKNGYFKDTEDFSEWKRFSVNKECPRDYRIRYNPECAYLYFLYHYNPHVKNEGRKTIEVQISHKMIKCIKEIQREMQFWISKLGIGIEVNPSSNFFIGTFDRYDKHPVFKLYNIGLTGSETKLNECPQIPVCINTDDQGIFSTYLENEYALIALALEKAKDENGKNLYNRMFIYQWIENIRKLGLQLSFAKPESSNLEKFIDKIPECVHQ